MLTSCSRTDLLTDEGASNDNGDVEVSTVSVQSLRALWVTPNTIQWAWSWASSDEASFDHFELVVGDSESDVRNRSGTAVTWTATELPELGFLHLPETSGSDPVRIARTTGHLPRHTYFAQLRGVDVSGLYIDSNVASVTTQAAATQEIVIFDETDTAGYSIPVSMALSSTNPYSGTYHYRWLNDLCVAGERCFETLRRREMFVDVSALSSASFDQAFVELVVHSVDDLPSYWSHVRLAVDESRYFQYTSWTFANRSGYQVIQVPLGWFRDAVCHPLDPAGAALTYAELSLGLFELGVGANWPGGANIDLDAMRLRW